MKSAKNWTITDYSANDVVQTFQSTMDVPSKKDSIHFIPILSWHSLAYNRTHEQK